MNPSFQFLRRRKRPARCWACGTHIVLVPMVRADGQPGGTMPCENRWEYGDGRRTLIVLDEEGMGHQVVQAGPELLGREPHWGTCRHHNQNERR